MAKREIVWNLSEMFPSTTDPSVEKAIDDLTLVTQNFAKRYQGKIKDLSAKELLESIKSFEECFAKLEQIKVFAYLSFTANMTMPDTQALYDRVNKAKAKLDKMLAFYNIEVGNLVHENRRVINEQILQSYKHFLERLERDALHHLSEVEEKLIIEKDQFGINAWQELQGKWLNTRTFEVEVEGKKKVLSFSEAGGLLSNPDRTTRESAAKSIYSLLDKDGEIFASAIRNICNDWLSVGDRRKYDSPMEASLIANDIDQQTISNLLTIVGNHTDLYQRHLRLKAQILKLPKLAGHDIWAPVPDAPHTKFDYDTARKLVIEAYERFDEDYSSAVKDMFAKNHIDATPRFGKANGAFSLDWYEGKSAFILTNFTEDLNDVYTLAHELGHATHTYYYTGSQTILNCGMDPTYQSVVGLPAPAIVGETASIFGELLLTDLFLDQSKSEQEKKAIICNVLDGSGYAIFQVTARAWFEQSLYTAIKREEFLDYETISRYWVEARDKVLGNAVEYIDEAKAAWASTPHYYFPSRFYNYPYVYAQLFVYALYRKYLEEGKEFVPKFKKALSAGCSVSPVEIGKIVGLDVTDLHFWQLGLRQYEHFLEELEKIV